MADIEVLPKVAQFVTEKERAAELKRRMEEAMAPVINIMNEAKENGLTMSFNVALDNFGRHTIHNLAVVKPL